MKTVVTALAVVVALSLSCQNDRGRQSSKINSKNGSESLSDDSLMTLVEYRTFMYFWEGAEPVSGLARERIHIDGSYPENDMNVITSGGSGFGLMALIAGIERGFITRNEGFERFRKIVDYLRKADRFHGAWSHWINGPTGRVKPFSPKDNGADIVETAYLVQGLLAVRQYFRDGSEQEKLLAAAIDKMWREVEWNWFTKGGEKVIYWHWSPDYQWEMNFPVRGYNECLILYVLAASSPTYPVSPVAYHMGWAANGGIMNSEKADKQGLALRHNGAVEYGGPLFWSHYSYLGLDPRNLRDKYADYWEHNVKHTLINYDWCITNPLGFAGYSPDCWGLTASYSINGYSAHAPGNNTDKGVISPTAALSSFPYTPEYSMKALRHFYYDLGGRIWGKYGFYDAFSEQSGWFPQRYLAIDQGPQIVMIENFRSGLIWKLFMSAPEIRLGLSLLGFTYNPERQ